MTSQNEAPCRIKGDFIADKVVGAHTWLGDVHNQSSVAALAFREEDLHPNLSGLSGGRIRKQLRPVTALGAQRVRLWHPPSTKRAKAP
jgi:hypothetical protein